MRNSGYRSNGNGRGNSNYLDDRDNRYESNGRNNSSRGYDEYEQDRDQERKNYGYQGSSYGRYRNGQTSYGNGRSNSSYNSRRGNLRSQGAYDDDYNDNAYGYNSRGGNRYVGDEDYDNEYENYGRYGETYN